MRKQLQKARPRMRSRLLIICAIYSQTDISRPLRALWHLRCPSSVELLAALILPWCKGCYNTALPPQPSAISASSRRRSKPQSKTTHNFCEVRTRTKQSRSQDHHHRKRFGVVIFFSRAQDLNDVTATPRCGVAVTSANTGHYLCFLQRRKRKQVLVPLPIRNKSQPLL